MEKRQINKLQISSSRKEIWIPRQRAARATELQINGLIEAMMADLELAYGVVRAVNGKKQLNMRWAALAKKLNRDYGGAPKKSPQWQKLWQSMKRRTMKRLRDWRAAGEDEKCNKPLTATELKVAMVFKKKDSSKVKSEAGAVCSPLVEDEHLDLDTESPQHSDYHVDSSSETLINAFPGWGGTIRPSTPMQQLSQANESSQNGIHADPVHDPFAAKTHSAEAFPQFMDRLLKLEESRQSAETRGEQQLLWCVRRFEELEQKRHTLEQRRLEYEEKRLQLDRRRLQVDEAMLATLKEVLSKKRE